MGDSRRALMAAMIVAALACVACESGGTSAPTISPSASTSPSPPPAVQLTGLQADQPSPWKSDARTWLVELSWDEPGSFVVDHYEVARNGRTIAADVQSTSFADDGVVPGATFRYRVRAVDAAGVETLPATAVLTTKSPPVEDARLEGKFIAKLHITSQSNLQGGASGGGVLFVFDPACKVGPCDADLSFDGASGSLSRDHASYNGTVRAAFHLQSCTGGTITETLVFHLKVTKAAAIRHTWRAEKVEGSLDETASAPGCQTGHIAYRVTAVARQR